MVPYIYRAPSRSYTLEAKVTPNIVAALLILIQIDLIQVIYYKILVIHYKIQVIHYKIKTCPCNIHVQIFSDVEISNFIHKFLIF